MDSINREQPEQNHADLVGSEAVEKVQKLVDKAGSGFFTTHDGRTRPMAVQTVDDRGHLWFLSANDSHKNLALAQNPSVRMNFQGSAHAEFLSLDCSATVSVDRQKIDELWKPILKAWFTEGKEDPRITVIELTPRNGYYWDTKHGKAVAGVKTVIGAAIGVTMDDSIEGTLSF